MTHDYDPIAGARRTIRRLKRAGELRDRGDARPTGGPPGLTEEERARRLRGRLSPRFGWSCKWIASCPSCGKGGRGWYRKNRLRHVQHGIDTDSGDPAICVLC